MIEQFSAGADDTRERVFYTGSQLKFNVQVAQAGALYLFSEGHDKNGPSELNTLFPINGKAWLEANKNGPVNDVPYQFRNESGVIYLRVIWADEPIDSLDKIVKDSYKTKKTILDPGQQKELRDLFQQYEKNEPEVIVDEFRFHVTLKGARKIMMDTRKLEYQPDH